MKQAARPALYLSLIATVLLLVGCARKDRELQARLNTSMGTIVVRLFDDKTPKTVENFVGLATGEKSWTATDGELSNEPFYDGLTFHRVIEDFMIQGGCPRGDGTGGPGYRFEDETYTRGAALSGAIEDVDTARVVFEDVVLPAVESHDAGDGDDNALQELYREIMSARSLKPLLGKTVEEVLASAGQQEKTVYARVLIDSVRYGTLCMANAGPNTNGSQFFIVTKEGGAPWLDGKHTVFGEVIEGMEVAEAIEGVETGQRDRPLEAVVIESVEIEKVGGGWF